MSAPARRFFAGETEAKAVLEAAGHFGLSPDELAYRPVDKKHGFLRRPRVVIEVDPASPRRPREAERATPPPAPPRAERSAAPAAPAAAARAVDQPGEGHLLDAGLAEAHDQAQGAVGAVAAANALAGLAALRVTATAAMRAAAGRYEVRVEMAGADRQVLVARQGELLRAFEHLLRRMVRELPEGGLVLDSGGFRGERDETLRRRAAAAAAEVRRSGEAVVFEPLPAPERRVVHLAIQEEPGVSSASEGEGDLRRVRVNPGDKPPASD